MSRHKGARRLVQPKLAVDRSDLGRPDQPRVGDGDRVKRPFKSLQPKIEEFVQRRKRRAEIVILPDIGLQQLRMIRPAIENVGGGQSVALELLAKVLRNHSALHPIAGIVTWSFLQAPCLADNISAPLRKLLRRQRAADNVGNPVQ